MPITSINGIYNGFIVKYSDEQLQELLSLSNFELEGGTISNNNVYFPNPLKLKDYGIDHSNRPYRVILYNNNLIIPEFFSFDLKKWYSTFYSKIDKAKIKGVTLQGIVRTYDLIKDGSFFLVPSLSIKNSPIKVHLNNAQFTARNIFPDMKYAVETQSLEFSDRSNATVNKSVDLGWRIKDGKYDISVLLVVDALENTISFKAILSDAKTKRRVTTREAFDHKANIYHIKVIGK